MVPDWHARSFLRSPYHPAAQLDPSIKAEKQQSVQKAYDPNGVCFICGARVRRGGTASFGRNQGCLLHQSLISQLPWSHPARASAGPAQPGGAHLETFRIKGGVESRCVAPESCQVCAREPKHISPCHLSLAPRRRPRAPPPGADARPLCLLTSSGASRARPSRRQPACRCCPELPLTVCGGLALTPLPSQPRGRRSFRGSSHQGS